MPLVSIITAMHNQAEFARQCIESAINQTYKNWEMIIIDDFSTDNTSDIAKSYAKKDKRIRYIRHTKNWGARNLDRIYNQGLKLSHGEYFAILEGDDWWPTDKLEKQMGCFRDKDVVLSYGNSIMTRSNGFPIDIIYYVGDRRSLNNDPIPSVMERFSDFSFFILLSTVILRRNALLKIGGFKKDKYFPFTDVPTWYELSLIGKFYYCNEVVGYYRRHKTSSWVDVAKDSDAMLRSEMQKSYWVFTRRNSQKLNKLGFSIDKKKVSSEQSKILVKKKRNKNLSIFLHTLLFDDQQMIENAGRKALKDKKLNRKLKIAISIAIKMGDLRKLALFVSFNIKLVFYKIKRLVS